MKPRVSIVIVNYKVQKEVVLCIRSIVASNPKQSLEIIVVDNDEKNTLEKTLNKEFKRVIYIKSKKNLGFGKGNNLGAMSARGTYLFFLNPDTYFVGNPIDRLIDILVKNKNIGIVAPLLLNETKKPFPQQGSLRLTVFRSIVAFSFLNKLFPKNFVSRNYWLYDWDKNAGRFVGTVPGTAFMIPKSLFEKAGKFDEQFFLYFEEEDLCRRVEKLGFGMYIDTRAQIVHLWERSTSQFLGSTQAFKKSRFLFFKKHFGIIWAYFLTAFLSFKRF